MTGRRSILGRATRAALIASAVGVLPPSAPSLASERFSVLVVGATAGYRHDSIPAAIETIRLLGEESGAYGVTVLPEVADLVALSADLLAQHSVVVFASTSGELPLDETQKTALLSFIAAGGGFVGVHSATDTFYTWPEYGELTGAYFQEHPWTQEVRVTVEDATHPATQMLPSALTLTDEIYVFRSDVRARPNTQVLLSLDASSVSAVGDFPLAWCSPYGAGRVLYNALGHFNAVWQDPLFRAHLLAAIRWTAGR